MAVSLSNRKFQIGGFHNQLQKTNTDVARCVPTNQKLEIRN